jgi:outer membrane receptor protein involved in Fe transport
MRATTTYGRSAADVRPLPAVVFLLALAVGVVPPAASQDPKKVRKVKTEELEGFGERDISEIDIGELIGEQSEVGVASLNPATAEDAPGSVTVFKSDEIRNLGARNLLELLRFVPGFDVTFDNLGRGRIAVRGIGSTTIRGGSENVLILYDGVRLNEDVNGGATALNLDIPLDHALRVEVLRGPGASVFGDGALAAVVSIVSQTTEEFLGTEAGLGFGSFGTQQYSLRSGGILGKLKISGFIRFAETDGARRSVPRDAQTSADRDRVAAGLLPISVAPGSARDDVRDLDAAYAFSTEQWTFSFRTKSDRSDGFIGTADNLGRQTQLNTSQLGVDVSHARPLEGLGDLKVRAGFLRSEIRDLLEIYPSGYRLEGDFGSQTFGEPGGNGGVFEQTSFNSRRFDIAGSLSRDLTPAHKFAGGLALRHDTTYDLEANANLDLRTLTPVDPPEGSSLAPLAGAVVDSDRTTTSLYAEDVWKAHPRLTLTAGLRFDHLSDLGGTLNPRLALVGAVRDNLDLKLLYGRAFRAPTFRELAFDLPGGTGNSDLRLVKADELELAVLWQRTRLRLEAHPFLSIVRDTVVLPSLPVPGVTTTFTNASGVRSAGIELVASGSFGVSNSFFASYTFQDPKDRETGERVPGLPKGLLSLAANLDIRARVTLTPSLVVRSGRPRATGDLRGDVSGYAIFSVTARAKSLWRTLEVALSFDNLFGTDYEDPSFRGGVPGDYPRPGQRVLVHASFKF